MSTKANDVLADIATEKVDEVLSKTGWIIDPAVREMLIKQEYEKLIEREE